MKKIKKEPEFNPQYIEVEDDFILENGIGINLYELITKYFPNEDLKNIYILYKYNCDESELRIIRKRKETEEEHNLRYNLYLLQKKIYDKWFENNKALIEKQKENHRKRVIKRIKELQKELEDT